MDPQDEEPEPEPAATPEAETPPGPGRVSPTPGPLHYTQDRALPPPAGPVDPAPDRVEATPAVSPIMITKEHKRFIEFADAVRRERYVGLCFGAPGVGKTRSARTYSNWDQLAPHLHGTRASGSEHTDAGTSEVLAARAIMYTPKVHNSPHNIDKEISYLHDRLGWTVELMLHPGRGVDGLPSGAGQAELLLVDEADRLKTAGLEQLRDHHDRTEVGLILIGMPGIEKRLARYPQLYSRVGFVHHYKPLSTGEQAFVLAKHWPHLHLDDPDDFATTEAIAAITRITNGNFRLTSRLIAQIERILRINQLTLVTKEVVEAARENLVIGIM
ncbi:MAG: ATP-binding protein [Actinomycetia bacterium]|nr:ATP-binding protein [Actinomycetes bacterium]